MFEYFRGKLELQKKKKNKDDDDNYISIIQEIPTYTKHVNGNEATRKHQGGHLTSDILTYSSPIGLYDNENQGYEHEANGSADGPSFVNRTYTSEMFTQL